MCLGWCSDTLGPDMQPSRYASVVQFGFLTAQVVQGIKLRSVVLAAASSGYYTVRFLFMFILTRTTEYVNAIAI